MIDARNHPVDTDYRDVGAVAGAAHVYAASHGNTATGRHRFLTCEIVHHRIHDVLGQAGGVSDGALTVNPALGMHDVADGKADAADQIVFFIQFFQQRLQLCLVRNQKFHVVTGGKTQEAVAILLGDIGDVADEIAADQASRSDADRIEFFAGFTDMAQHAGLRHFMIEPLAVIAFDDRRQHRLIIGRAEICSSHF